MPRHSTSVFGARPSKTRPYGSPPGKPGRNTLNGKPLPGKINFRARPGDRVRIETPGGGGL